MRIAVGQINPIVGDVRHNTGIISRFIERAKEKGADLVIFPELAVTGYPPRDLLLHSEALQLVQRALAEIQLFSREIGVIVGAPIKDSLNKRLYNSALLYKRGSLFCRQDKTLLPNYEIFDESRYFSEGRERRFFTIGHLKIGCTIAEDLLNTKDCWKDQCCEDDPVHELALQGADIIVNIAASPYHYGMRKSRADILCEVARKYGKTVVFVNQVGGNDELIFDGSSLVIAPGGGIIWQGRAFEEDFTVVDLPNKNIFNFQVKEGIDCIHDALVLGIRDYIRKVGLSKAVLGLSGGIDSAVAAVLAVEALGSENVLGVAMPSRYSSAASLADARHLAQNLGIELREISIEGLFSAYIRDLIPGKPLFQDVAEENLQARIRGNILMFISNREGHLVLCPSNKSELAVGYTTLYGDMSGGLCVLGDVFKTTVYDLANYINRRREVIPQGIITKPPSAELKPDQKDEDSLPPYSVLDPILKAYIEDNMSPSDIAAQGFEAQIVNEVIKKVNRSEFKRRQAPPILRVTSNAFGSGRRFPIAWRMS